MKLMLMTAAIAILLGTTAAYGASTLNSSATAIEKTDAIADQEWRGFVFSPLFA